MECERAGAVWFGQLGDSGAVHSDSLTDSVALPHVP